MKHSRPVGDQEGEKIMIGQSMTLVRVRPERDPVTYRQSTRTFTTRGVITDVNADDDGNVTGVCVRGMRNGTEPVHSWFAVGPGALHGSLCVEQTATLDACGHAVTYGCDCDTIAAEAADQD